MMPEAKTDERPDMLRNLDWRAFRSHLAERLTALQIICTKRPKGCSPEMHDQILSDLAWPNFVLLVEFCRSFSVSDDAKQPSKGS